MKKVLSVLVSLMLLLAMLPLGAVSVSAGTYGLLSYNVYNGQATIIDCTTSAGGHLVIPSTIEEYPVTAISSCAFEGCEEFTSVTIPDSVTKIGHYAFRDCTKITSVTIPDSVTSIGQYAFANCTKLTSVTLPDSITTISANMFYQCSSLTEVAIPDSVTTIGDSVFCQCSSLTEVTIPDSVTAISRDAFSDCYNLSSVTLGNKVTCIGRSAFAKCYDLTSIIIPCSVTTIEYNAFYRCDALTDVYYEGTASERAAITIDSYNDPLSKATWHYHEHVYDNVCDTDCNDCGHVREVPHMYDNACDAACNGCGAVRTPADHVYDHDFDVDCNECGDIREVEMPLSFGGNSVSEDVSGLAFKFDVDVLEMAVINGTTAVYDNATIDGFRLIKMGALVSNSKLEIDIEAVYLCDLKADSVSYAVRIINIPAENYDSVITAIPYFIVEIDGVVTTIYGEVQTATFNNVKN